MNARAMESLDAAPPKATVLIPTFNGGQRFADVLTTVMEQETSFAFDVLCIDSGSLDGTQEVIATHGARLIEIRRSEFDHGLTRDLGVRESRGEIVALLTQDAEPADTGWLQRLVDTFDDPEVAGAWCHQIPRPTYNPFQRHRMRGVTRGSGEPIRQHLAPGSRWKDLEPRERYLLSRFDNVASAVRRSVALAIPFGRRAFGEDSAWGKRAILAGHTLVLQPAAQVVHSHDRSVLYEFRRTYLDHQNLYDLFGLRTVPTLRHVVRFSVHLSRELIREIWADDRPRRSRCWWTVRTVPYAIGQNLAQFLGARSVSWMRHGVWRRIDELMRRGIAATTVTASRAVPVDSIKRVT